jgi:hypothetical protein
MATFEHPPATPSAITYKSIEKTWTQWGWQVSVNRAQAQAFSGLVGASATGYTISTKSQATVTTPAVYSPGATFTVSARGGKVSSGASVTADAAGRLTITTKPSAGHNAVTVQLTPA